MSAVRKFYTASNPQGVLDKLQECRRALARMEQIDRTGSDQEFLDSLGHFLESFRTVSQRFYGVVKKQSGRPRMKALEDQLNSHPRIGFIIDRAVLETHGDGATIWRRFNVSVFDNMQERWPARWSGRRAQGAERWPSRFGSRFHPTAQTTVLTGRDWQFAERLSTSLLELCRIGLDDLENVIKQNLSVTRSKTFTAYIRRLLRQDGRFVANADGLWMLRSAA